MSMNKIAMALSFLLVFTAGCGPALKTLIEAGKSQTQMQEIYKTETKRFETVKKGIKSGAISKGLSKEKIVQRYGEPVVIVSDSQTGREKWVYKPASSSFFEGAKIYLFFDNDGALDEIKMLRQ